MGWKQRVRALQPGGGYSRRLRNGPLIDRQEGIDQGRL